MRFYLISISLLLLLSGCGSTPDIALTPKLSHYATAQKQCSDFIEGKSELTGIVEKECKQFLVRLDTANTTANQLASGTLKKGEAKERKILYARERNKLDQAYQKLSGSIKDATLAAIKDDDVKKFQKGIAFPGNTFIEPYYVYMKSKTPQFDKNVYYLDFQRDESARLMLQAQQNLKQGKKSKALALFEKAANLGNAQAARSTALLYEQSKPEKALEWHLKAADGGIKASYLNLGHLYENNGKKELALEWYLKAAAQNSAKAQYRLYLYFLDTDKSKAISWLQQSSKNGYIKAQYTYALVLMKEEKSDEAINLLQQASQKNCTRATDYLGKYFYDLKLYGNAFKQLKNSKSADSFYLRAKMLEEGAGREKDYRQAYTFYFQADSLGKKGAKKDMQRVDALLSKEQKKRADEQKREQAKQIAAMTKECGAAPTPAAIKKRGRKFHIIGTASTSVGRQSFIIYGDNGEDYYLLRAKGIQADDKVDISVLSTGLTATINSAEEDNGVDIYQFTFIKECTIEERQ